MSYCYAIQESPTGLKETPLHQPIHGKDDHSMCMISLPVLNKRAITIGQFETRETVTVGQVANKKILAIGQFQTRGVITIGQFQTSLSNI